MGVRVLFRQRMIQVVLPVVLVLAATAIAASFATGNPPQQSAGGIFPVPGMGPPGAGAAFGAMMPQAGPPNAGPTAQPAPLLAAKFLTPPGVHILHLRNQALEDVRFAGRDGPASRLCVPVPTHQLALQPWSIAFPGSGSSRDACAPSRDEVHGLPDPAYLPQLTSSES